MTGFLRRTMVRVDEGQFMSFGALADHPQDWHVVTFDPRTNQTAMRASLNPMVQGQATELTTVVIHGENVICTPDVGFLMADRTYKAAADLKAGDVLRTWPMGVYALESDATAITLPAPVDVYDVSVPPPSNFALALGPFVRALGSTWT